MRKQKIINLIKTVLFIALAVLMTIGIGKITTAKWITSTRPTIVVDETLAQKKNTVELVFLGGSQIGFGVSSMELAKNYDIASFTNGMAHEPFRMNLMWLKYLNSRNDIRVVGMDVSMLYELEEEERFRQSLDGMPMSKLKLETILELCRDDVIEDDMWSYIFPIMKYHTRWNELTQDDYDYEDSTVACYKGAIVHYTTTQATSFEDFCIDNEAIDPAVTMEPNQLKYFREIMDYCSANGIKVFLFKTPKKTWTMSKCAGVTALAEEYGVDYIDFNLAENLNALDLDYLTDIRDIDHLSYQGQDKLTDYLGRYLTGKYEFSPVDKERYYAEGEIEKYEARRERCNERVLDALDEYEENNE